MGSTFGALHIRNGDLDRTLEWITGQFDLRGLALIEDASPERDDEHHVLVFANSDWVVVSDEDVEVAPDQSGPFARRLSEALEADVTAISVFHSDVAVLERFRRGKRKGRLEVPEDGVLDRATGRTKVAAKFLADLAVSADARAELEAGLAADLTFPESTISRAAELIGLPHPGASARYAWSDPPADAHKLRFRAEVDESDESSAASSFLPIGGDGPLTLEGPEGLAVCVGVPLQDQSGFSLTSTEGKRIDGLVVELDGSALELLDVPEIGGCNPDGRTEIEVARVDDGKAAFPTLCVAPSAPMGLSMSRGGMRAFASALAAQSKNRFMFHLRGTARSAGSGELVVRVKDTLGNLLDETRMACTIEPAPRHPVVPWPPDADEPFFQTKRRLDAMRAYDGNGWLSGWLASGKPGRRSVPFSSTRRASSRGSSPKRGASSPFRSPRRVRIRRSARLSAPWTISRSARSSSVTSRKKPTSPCTPHAGHPAMACIRRMLTGVRIPPPSHAPLEMRKVVQRAVDRNAAIPPKMSLSLNSTSVEGMGSGHVAIHVQNAAPSESAFRIVGASAATSRWGTVGRIEIRGRASGGATTIATLDMDWPQRCSSTPTEAQIQLLSPEADPTPKLLRISNSACTVKSTLYAPRRNARLTDEVLAKKNAGRLYYRHLQILRAPTACGGQVTVRADLVNATSHSVDHAQLRLRQATEVATEGISLAPGESRVVEREAIFLGQDVPISVAGDGLGVDEQMLDTAAVQAFVDCSPSAALLPLP